MVRIAPSLLAANFAYLADEIIKVERAGADMLHLDIMDGHFVPNLTFGSSVVAALRSITKLPFDVHLMVSNPQDHIEPFIKAGSDFITVHTEATPHIHRLLQSIRGAGVKAAISLNPATPLAAAEEILIDVDMVLIMSVNPGYGGQTFIPSSLDKIRRLCGMIKAAQRTIDIEVDGGINRDNASSVIEAGADILVAGSAVYGAPDAAEAIRCLRQ